MPYLNRHTSFNSRAHKGRDSANPDEIKVSEVSIHAPTRGATLCISLVLTSLIQFQFTRPQGARQLGGVKELRPSPVSIHAPTRGATDAFVASLYQ